MLEWLDRIPQPWDMVIAWILYIGIVCAGFITTVFLVRLIGT